jgi:hypothetical protein
MDTNTTKMRTVELQPVTILGWYTTPKLNKSGEVVSPSQRVDVLDPATCVHTAENGNKFIKCAAVAGHHTVESVGLLRNRKCTIFRDEEEDFIAFLTCKKGSQVALDTNDWDTKKSKKDDLSDLDSLEV